VTSEALGQQLTDYNSLWYIFCSIFSLFSVCNLCYVIVLSSAVVYELDLKITAVGSFWCCLLYQVLFFEVCFEMSHCRCFVKAFISCYSWNIF